MAEPRALDPVPTPAHNGARRGPSAQLVEQPDPGGARWAIALELLLEAGRGPEDTDPAA